MRWARDRTRLVKAGCGRALSVELCEENPISSTELVCLPASWPQDAGRALLMLLH